MEEGEWSVIRCVGPQEEPMWSVVHRRKPMFVAVVSDQSVDRLETIPAGAIHWAKHGRAEASRSLLREALDAIRACRSGSRKCVGEHAWSGRRGAATEPDLEYPSGDEREPAARLVPGATGRAAPPLQQRTMVRPGFPPVGPRD